MRLYNSEISVALKTTHVNLFSKLKDSVQLKDSFCSTNSLTVKAPCRGATWKPQGGKGGGGGRSLGEVKAPCRGAAWKP